MLVSLFSSDREVGDRLRIAEIRQLVKDDPNFQDLSKEQESEMRDELLASRCDRVSQIDQTMHRGI